MDCFDLDAPCILSILFTIAPLLLPLLTLCLIVEWVRFFVGPLGFPDTRAFVTPCPSVGPLSSLRHPRD